VNQRVDVKGEPRKGVYCSSTEIKESSQSEEKSCCSSTEVKDNSQSEEKSCCSSIEVKDSSQSEGKSCCSSTETKDTSQNEKTSCCSTKQEETEEPIVQASKKAKTYIIEGMDCGACAKSLENHLRNVSSVAAVNVSFSTGKMQIEHDNSVEDIQQEVEKAGYKATFVSSPRQAVKTEKQSGAYNSLIASGVAIALGFLGTYAGISETVTTFLYAFAIIISGYKPAKSAYYAVKSRSLDMNVLMTMAAVGAALIGEWLEGATVVWLFALGAALQARSIEQTRKSIRNLMDLAPPEAWIKVDGKLVKKAVEEVTIGQMMVVKPGEKIPLDGEVIAGQSSVNQAPITGESIPVDKEAGDAVYAGTINENGSLEVKVTKLVDDTTISKIIHLVEEAQEKKAPTEAFVDKFAAIYTPIVFVVALLMMIVLPLLGLGEWGEWFYKGLELLVIACPCALVISTPVAIVSAIGNAAKNGVLIKGGTFLEAAGRIKAVAFDKTGTLTEGKPAVSDVLPLMISEERLISIAAALEEYSTHPIAKSIVQYAQEKRIPSLAGADFKSITGKGVQAVIDGNVHYAGNMKLFVEIGTPFGESLSQIERLQAEGKTIIIIGTDKEIFGVISVADAIRPAAVSALSRLQMVGVEQMVMLTGDNEGTAKRIAAESGVNRYFAELLPEDKVSAVKRLQQEGYKTAMVGDGINDAPALATADLGIAMGGAGTDTAMETADIVLMADNLEKLPYTIHLSKRALTIIKQNVWFSLIIKAIALLLIFPGWLTLWMAVLSDTGAALIVILNSLRLMKVNSD
jgi:Cd2+/Zn2+-exporting ATPase